MTEALKIPHFFYKDEIDMSQLVITFSLALV